MTESKIATIYITHTCHYCYELADWFEENNIAYEIKFIDTDSKAQQELENHLKHPIDVVPITIIDKKIIAGFDIKKIKEALDEIKKI